MNAQTLPAWVASVDETTAGLRTMQGHEVKGAEWSLQAIRTDFAEDDVAGEPVLVVDAQVLTLGDALALADALREAVERVSP